MENITQNELPLDIKKYLNKFASDKWKTFSTKKRSYKTVIVIPAIAEYENIKHLIASLLQNNDEYLAETLILFVINNNKTSSAKIKVDNMKTTEYLSEIIIKHPKLNLDFIDAFSPATALDNKDGGVGLARKIGMDYALRLFNYNSPRKNIIICLDADCTVEQNYIKTIRQYFDNYNIDAGYVNFKHPLSENKEEQYAIINYEIFLRYYVLGLKYARSPFAYHSIGSTMVCSSSGYIKVQGMNKRKAAEDFYFMEKLSKITEIKKIDGTAVLPSGRGSWRVPFGTGQRVNRFLGKTQNEYLLYSPSSFVVLKNWLTLFHSQKTLSADQYLTEAKRISVSLLQFLIKNNFEKNWKKIIENSSSEKQIKKQKQFWFDGFKTLKLIHYLRDTEFPSINMFNALDEIFALMDISFEYRNKMNQIPPLAIQKKYLEKLREIA